MPSSNSKMFLKSNSATTKYELSKKGLKDVNKQNNEALEKIGENINDCIKNSFKSVSDEIAKSIKAVLESSNIKDNKIQSESKQNEENNDNLSISQTVDKLITRIIDLEQANKKSKETVNQLNIALVEHLKKCNDKIETSNKKIVTYNPALLIDSMGNPSANDENNKQPLDYANVVAAKSIKPPRPSLSISTEEKINEALITEPIMEEIEINTESITAREKNERIQILFNEAKNIIGFSPIKPDEIENLIKIMDKKKAFNNEDNYQTKKSITIKSMIKSWSKKHLKMTEEEWNEINVTEIKQVSLSSNIIFIKCSSSDEISKITSKAKNLPSDNLADSPRLVTFVHKQSQSRYKAFHKVAKHIRSTSNHPVKTNIRYGKTDFLLRVQPKSSNQPWGKIAPIIINHQLPDFNVGIIKRSDESINYLEDIDENLRQINKRKASNSDNADNLQGPKSTKESVNRSKIPKFLSSTQDFLPTSNMYSVLDKDLELSTSLSSVESEDQITSKSHDNLENIKKMEEINVKSHDNE